MYYYEYLYYLFLPALLIMVSWLTWRVVNSKSHFQITTDPRWKNRNAIVDFVFLNITIQGTLIIAIAGMITQ